MKPTVKLVFISSLSAILLTLQVAISFLPNIELVSLLLIVYSFKLGKKDMLLTILLFSLLEGIVWGFGDWVIGYMWIWPVLYILTIIFKPILKSNSSYWAILSAIWGFLFGILFAIQHAIMYGINMGYAYWLNGLLFDVIHAVGNYIVTILLFEPLTTSFEKLYNRLEVTNANHN